MRILSIFVAVLLGLTASPALAQFDVGASSFFETQIAIELDNEFPTPGQEVTASLNDYSGSVYGATVVWKIDDQIVPNSVNLRSITFIAGQSGTTQLVECVLTKPNGDVKVLERVITPLHLDIIVEPQTRVPNFYLGRSLPSIGSVVNATALLNDSGVDPDQMVYTWRINQTVIESGPIRSRNRVSFEMPMGNSAVLAVKVTDSRGNSLGSRAILLPSVTPEIRFYEVSALFGESQRPYQRNIPMIGSTVTVKAEPYYLDSRVYNDPDIIEWKIDGKTSNSSFANPYEVTLQRVKETGVSELELHVRDTKQILQGTKASIQLTF